MKNLFKSLFLLTFAATIGLSGCKKTDSTTTTTTTSAAPTVYINGVTSGVATNTVSLSADSISMVISATADTDRKIKKITITRAIAGQSTVTIFNKADYAVKNLLFGFIDTITSGGHQFTILEDDIITYTVSVTDDNGNAKDANYKVTIASLAVSPQIYIGAPACADGTNPYRFFGVSDNYQRYRPGSDSTLAFLARNNSAKIDFVYFYSTSGSVQNAIYSPDYDFGVGNGWNAEISNWTTKRTTLYHQCDLTSSAFDALIGSNFLNEINLVDFSTGSVSKMSNLSVNQVFAYKKWNGKRGFIKVGQPSSSNSGQILFIVKSEL